MYVIFNVSISINVSIAIYDDLLMMILFSI